MMPLDCLPLYSRAEWYDCEHTDYVVDLEFYRGLALAANGPVLEIACGTGRLTLPLAQSGVQITGLDVSPEMLALAQKKAAKKNLAIDFQLADCRHFELHRKFNFIFIAYNAMQHLHGAVSLAAFFSCVKNHLAPEGVFALNVFNPSIKILARDPKHRFPAFDEYTVPSTGDRVRGEESSHYDAATQVNRITWYFTVNGKRDAVVETLNLRCFFPQELDALLDYHGFETIKKHGGFKHEPFSSTSPTQAVVCKVRR